MTTLDARSLDTWVVSIRQYLISQQKDMKSVFDKIVTLSTLDNALTGDGGDAIKLFYRESHHPLLLFYEATVTQLLTFLEHYQSARMDFDSASTAYVETSFLEHELTSSLQRLRSTITDMVDQLNRQADTISDIVHLPGLQDADVIEGIELGLRRGKETAESLEEFDHQQLQGISAIHKDVTILRNYIEKLTNAVQAKNFSLRDYKSGDFTKHDWYEDLHSTLLVRAEEFLSPELQKELATKQYTSIAHNILDYFKSIKDSMGWGDNLFVGSRMAVAGYYTILSRSVSIHYPNGKPSLIDRFKRNYTFTVRASDSWKASTGYSNPIARLVHKIQQSPLPQNKLLKEVAQYFKGYPNPSSFSKHITGFAKNKTAPETLLRQQAIAVERSKYGLKELASNVADTKGLSKVSRGIPVVGNAVTVVSNFQEFTDSSNVDKSVSNKLGRFAAGTIVDLGATAAGAKVGAVIGSFGGPVGIVVGGAIGAAVGATLSTKYGDSIKEVGGNATEAVVKFGSNLKDKAGDAFKSIGSWFK
ncbi:T7SS effector LXG polymorphic toxin [Metabacillus herbersteinensis]|uniref:T7SS effector LXG polymorphic toxin n=1 Tax=Metabacillus herbersteinensis TaxID=283816 RepID=A0ABV6GG89_9BACI